MKPFMFCNDYRAIDTDEIITITNSEEPRTITLNPSIPVSDIDYIDSLIKVSIKPVGYLKNFGI